MLESIKWNNSTQIQVLVFKFVYFQVFNDYFFIECERNVLQYASVPNDSNFFYQRKEKSLYTAITILKVWNQHSPLKACFEQRNIDFTHGRVWILENVPHRKNFYQWKPFWTLTFTINIDLSSKQSFYSKNASK